MGHFKQNASWTWVTVEPRGGQLQINGASSGLPWCGPEPTLGAVKALGERAGRRVVLGAAGAVLLLTGLVVAFFARSYEGVLQEAFRERSVAYAAAFADAAGSWLAREESETARQAARFLLMGSAFYVQAVVRGEVLLDERVERADSLALPPLSVLPSARTVGIARLDRGPRYFDVLIPIVLGSGEAGGSQGGYVRVGIDASSIAARSRGMTLLASGAAALVDLLLIGAFLLLFRRSRLVRAERGSLPAEASTPEEAILELGGLRIDESRKEVTLLGQKLSLTPKQYALLHLLARSPGRVFSDREIVAAIWPDSAYANSKDVKQQVYLLRRRLAAAHPEGAGFVANVPGFGYRLAHSDVDEGLTGS